MPRNGSGTYTLPAGNPVVTGTTISSTVHNTTMSDLATGITNSLAKDGQTVPTTNLPMGTYRHTGVGNGVARTDYAALGQIQDNALQSLSSVAGTNTITASLTNLTAYVVGQSFEFIPANTNTGATTLNISGIGAGAVQANGAALVGGEIKQNVPVRVKVTATTPVFEIIGNGATAIPFEIATHAATSKATPVDADEFGFLDSAAAFVLKKLPWANIKAALKTYFDTLYAAISNTYVPARQTVLTGPVDSSGFSAFGGSTGSTTVTATGTLKATAAAGGDANYTGSITNPSWTGLSTNGTMYLYLDITSAGVVTTGSTTVAPTYQWGGTYSTTNNQHTFNIQEMTMKAGNGSVASQVNRVFVGEVTVAGGVVTAITWYALMGRYDSGYTNTLPGVGTNISKNHNIGTVPRYTSFEIKCLTTDSGYAVGDVVSPYTQGAAGFVSPFTPSKTANAMQVTTGSTSSFVLNNKTTGTAASVGSLANWAYRMIADRGW